MRNEIKTKFDNIQKNNQIYFLPLRYIFENGKSYELNKINEILDKIDKKKENILSRRGSGETLESAAKDHGYTRERIRQIEGDFIDYFLHEDHPMFKDMIIAKFNELIADGKLPPNEVIQKEIDHITGFNKLPWYRKVHFLIDSIVDTKDNGVRTWPQGWRYKIIEHYKLDKKYEEEEIATSYSVNRVVKEIKEFAREIGKPDFMPFQRELAASNRTYLRALISKYGGQSKIAKLAGLNYQGQIVGDGRGRTYWTDEKAKEYIREVADHYGHPDDMPTQGEVMEYSGRGNVMLINLLGTATKSPRATRWYELANFCNLRFNPDSHRLKLDINYIRKFVKSLKNSINHLTPSEVYVLLQQAGLKKNTTYNQKLFENLVTAIQSGNLPKDELDKWTTGDDSQLIDNLLNEDIDSIENAFSLSGIKYNSNSSHQGKTKPITTDDPYQQIQIDDTLPSPSVIDSLKSLGVAAKTLSKFGSDSEAINFFIAKATGKLWKRCFENEEEAINEAKSLSYNPKNEYEIKTRQNFLDEYNNSKQLPLPINYDFTDKKGNLLLPNLMQKLIAYRVLKNERVLNLSGTGTGKTLSAILASRVIGSRLTIVACPNNTIRGWKKEIMNSFSDSIVYEKNITSEIDHNRYNYVLLNHEYLTDTKESLIKKFILKNEINFIIIDEIHRAKQRDTKSESQRRRVLTGLITDVPAGQAKPRVLGLSATPVINNLFEGKSLVELVTSEDHSDVGEKTSLENCMKLYQKFVTLGFRQVTSYRTDRLPKLYDIDCSDCLPDLLTLGRKAHAHAIEKILIRPKWECIKKNLRKKTVIFVDYVTDIVPFLKEMVKAEGFSVGVYTGSEKYSFSIEHDDALEEFIDGDTDVLIASIKTVATGVDGLQTICNNVIFAHLPWTNTEYEQAIGRFDRQGSNFDTLDIHIPKTFAKLSNGEVWSWCDSKLKRIQTKKDVANAAVDGEIPDDENQLSPSKATSYWMEWLERLNTEGAFSPQRKELRVPLDESNEEVVSIRYAKYGQFSSLNAKWNNSLSSTTHSRLKDNPEEWYYYHTEYQKKEKEWDLIPRKEIIEELPLTLPEGSTVADYGCGLAEIAESLSEKYKVYSLDHIAVNENVIECDMAETPLQDSSLDAAIFSLSLMGKNLKDYIDDAYRCIKIGGQLIIYHPAKSNDVDKFNHGLESNGFAVIRSGTKYKWHYIWAIKQAKKINTNKEISF